MSKFTLNAGPLRITLTPETRMDENETPCILLNLSRQHVIKDAVTDVISLIELDRLCYEFMSVDEIKQLRDSLDACLKGMG